MILPSESPTIGQNITLSGDPRFPACIVKIQNRNQKSQVTDKVIFICIRTFSTTFDDSDFVFYVSLTLYKSYHEVEWVKKKRSGPSCSKHC